MPFTSPTLAGVRLRRGHGGRVEVLVPNPAGGQGCYVVDPMALPQLCRLTLHDEVLLERLMEHPVLTPRVVRTVALEVAATGLAGRQAADAARAALAERAGEREVGAGLLLLLLRELEVDVEALVRASGSRSLRALARRQLAARVDRIGLAPEEVLAEIDELAPHVAAIGPSGSRGGRYAAVLVRLGRLRGHLRRWVVPEGGQAGAAAQRVAETVCAIRRIAGTLLRVCRRRLVPVSGLVVAWRRDPGLRGAIEDLEWWLEGWDEPLARFGEALRRGREVQNATVHELARHVLPFEAAVNGRDLRIETAERGLPSRRVRACEDWRTGLLVTEWLERIERTRAEAWS